MVLNTNTLVGAGMVANRRVQTDQAGVFPLVTCISSGAAARLGDGSHDLFCMRSRHLEDFLPEHFWLL